MPADSLPPPYDELAARVAVLTGLVGAGSGAGGGACGPVEAVLGELVEASFVGRVGQAVAEVAEAAVGSGSGAAERPGRG